MTWTMMVVIFGGIVAAPVVEKIGFRSKDACVVAATDISKASTDRLVFICVSSETGETFIANGKR